MLHNNLKTYSSREQHKLVVQYRSPKEMQRNYFEEKHPLETAYLAPKGTCGTGHETQANCNSPSEGLGRLHSPG